ncbi:hypothetical protein IHC18_003039 [Escherichia coli]|nr:hypothetical protein [Escherichia coli]
MSDINLVILFIIYRFLTCISMSQKPVAVQQFRQGILRQFLLRFAAILVADFTVAT